MTHLLLYPFQTIMRMMDNCSIETDHVKTIQDDLNYYVESNQEPDFAENELMYEDLELEETMSNMYSTTGEWGCSLSLSLSLLCAFFCHRRHHLDSLYRLKSLRIYQKGVQWV